MATWECHKVVSITPAKAFGTSISDEIVRSATDYDVNTCACAKIFSNRAANRFRLLRIMVSPDCKTSKDPPDQDDMPVTLMSMT